jgi:cyclase
LVFIDTQGSKASRDYLVEFLREAASECFIPLTAGGGVRSIADARQLFMAGADKVVITSAAIEVPGLISQIAKYFGSQSVIACIEYIGSGNSAKITYQNGSKSIDLNLIDYAIQLEQEGAGEIMLNSIENDGLMNGYDINLAKQIIDSVSVPVIVSGGAGNFMHIFDLFTESDASGAVCASLFHFGDNTPIRARSYLKNLNIQCRTLK